MREKSEACDQLFVNMLSIYTLTPGVTSSFKSIRVCTELCPYTDDKKLLKLSESRSSSEEDLVALQDPFSVFSGALLNLIDYLPLLCLLSMLVVSI